MIADLDRRDAAAPDAAPEWIDAKGFVILRGAASGETIARVAAELSPHFDATPFCQGSFYGSRTKRFGRLLSRSDATAELVLHREVFALAEQLLAPWCDTIQLNLTQAIEIHPGALPQFPHRDQGRGSHASASRFGRMQCQCSNALRQFNLSRRKMVFAPVTCPN